MAEPIRSQRQLLLVNSTSASIAQIVNLGILFWVNQYLLTRLTPEEYAPYPVVLSVSYLLQIVETFLVGGIARHVAEAYNQSDRKRVTELVSSIFPLCALSGLTFLVLGVFGGIYIADILTISDSQAGEAGLMLGLLLTSQGVLLAIAPLCVGLYVKQKFVLLSGIALGREILRGILIVFLLILVSTSVTWVVVATVTSATIAGITTMWLSKREVPELKISFSSFRLASAKTLTNFGAWIMLGNMVSRIGQTLDVLILNRWGSNLDVTSFHIGMLPGRQVERVMGSAVSTVQPALVALHTSANDDYMRNAYLRGNRYYLWASLAIITPLVLFSDPFILLYIGQSYLLIGTVMALATARLFFQSANQMLYQVAIAKAKIKSFFIISTVAAVFHFCLILVLVVVYEYGAVGAAAAHFVTSTVFQIFFYLPLGLSLLDLKTGRFFRDTIVPGYLPAILSAPICLLIGEYFLLSSWTRLGIATTVVLLIYFACMLFVLPDEDKDEIARALRRYKQRP